MKFFFVFTIIFNISFSWASHFSSNEYPSHPSSRTTKSSKITNSSLYTKVNEFLISIKNNDIEKASHQLKKFAEDGYDIGIIYLVLDTGAETTIQNIIVQQDRLEIFKLLIEYGVDVNFPTPEKITPILTALALPQENFVKFLMKQPSTQRLVEFSKVGTIDLPRAFVSMHEASFFILEEGLYYNIMKILIKDKGFDPNSGKIDGYTFLAYAVVEGLSPIVKLILDNKSVDLDQQRDPLRWNLLHVAIQHGHYELIEILLKAGVDPYQKTEGRKPLDSFELAKTQKDSKIDALLSNAKKSQCKKTFSK